MKKEDLKRMIASSRNIIDTNTSENVTNTDNFNRLLSILINFSIKNNLIAFALHLKEEDLQSLNFTEIAKNLITILDQIALNNFFLVDGDLNIEKSSLYYPGNSEEAREVFKENSKNNHCIIAILKDVSSVFFNGIEITNATFVAEADLKNWVKKKDISQLLEVIEEYKTYIRNRTIYNRFFAHKPILVRLFDSKFYDYRNTLKNKPENDLRNDLRNFLQERISRTLNFSREIVLDSNKRLDIYTEDEVGNYYFLEIKWVGKSLNSKATAVKFGFDENRAQEGMKQTLEYIDEMTKLQKTVKLGCLVIFDARLIKTPLPYDWSKVDVELRKYTVPFKTIELPIDNDDPS